MLIIISFSACERDPCNGISNYSFVFPVQTEKDQTIYLVGDTISFESVFNKCIPDQIIENLVVCPDNYKFEPLFFLSDITKDVEATPDHFEYFELIKGSIPLDTFRTLPGTLWFETEYEFQDDTYSLAFDYHCPQPGIFMLCTHSRLLVKEPHELVPIDCEDAYITIKIKFPTESNNEHLLEEAGNGNISGADYEAYVFDHGCYMFKVEP